MSDQNTISVYNKQAAQYASLTESEARDKQLLDFIASIPKGEHVLDLGCGPGHCAATMADHGLHVTAIDASAEMVVMAAKHAGVTALQGTFDDLQDTETYAGVWANFSLLHAPRKDMPRHLNSIAKALLPAGKFHIGLKLGESESRDALGRFYTYYTVDVWPPISTNAGFTITKSTLGSGAGLSGEVSDWITVVAHA